MQWLRAETLVVARSRFLLSMLMNFRRRRRGAQFEPRGLESIISEFAHQVTSCSRDQVDEAIQQALSGVLEISGARRVCWYMNDASKSYLEKIYSICGPGVPPAPQIIYRDEIPFTVSQLLNHGAMCMESVDALPEEAQADRRFFEKEQIRGLLITVSNCGTSRKGILAVSFIPPTTQLPLPSLEKLRFLNDLIVATQEKKVIYERLETSEKQFRHLADHAPIGIALEDTAGHICFANPALCSLLGYSEQELLGMTCSSVSEGDDGEPVLFQKLLNREIDRYTIEKRLIRKDGARMWGRVKVALLGDERRQAPLVIGMMEDITDQKRAEADLSATRNELQELARYLIQSQDEVRRRISRDLHDDFGQRLSLLSIELDSFADKYVNAGQHREAGRLKFIKSQTDALIADVHELSHELHSTKLQHLGLRSAIDELVKNVERQNQFSIECIITGNDQHLPGEVALGLFRITQEAMTNIIHHSGATKTVIEIDIQPDSADMRIADNGVGFDVAREGTGLGLVSMRERLRMLGGELQIVSYSGKGTTIYTSVPLAATGLAKKTA